MTLPQAIVYLGGSLTEVELMQAFRTHGIHVVLVDRNADAPGRVCADHFINLSVTDEDAICAALSPLRARYRFLAAYGVVDYSFSTVRALTEFLGLELNAPQIYAEFTDKLKTKARLEKGAVPTAQTLAHGRKFDESVVPEIVAASRCGTVVIKASEACNSEGVRIVRTSARDDLREAICQAIELSGEFYCEEYVSGTLHNLDMILDPEQAVVVAVTDRYRMADGITSLAGFQESLGPHPLHEHFGKLALRIGEVFHDYRGPLTADVLAANDELKVLEISPHLHVPKLQALRDADLVGIWPKLLTSGMPEVSGLGENDAASAYVRIYGDDDAESRYFDPSWIAAVETFPTPRRFGHHVLRRILYLKSESASLLKERVHGFVDENAR